MSRLVMVAPVLLVNDAPTMGVSVPLSNVPNARSVLAAEPKA